MNRRAFRHIARFSSERQEQTIKCVKNSAPSDDAYAQLSRVCPQIQIILLAENQKMRIFIQAALASAAAAASAPGTEV